MLGDTLSIIVPTAGRASLRNTLLSYAHQMRDADELMVVGDTTDGRLSQTEELVAEFDQRFRYIDGHGTHHSWGHNEIGIGLGLARGDYLLGNDDDDIATPTALADIREAIAEQPHPRPLLFQFMTPWRQVLWQRREIVEGAIGGHCLVQPNVPGKIAYLTPRYSGDYDWIMAASDLYGGDVAWVPRVIAWTRPTVEELVRMIPEGVLA